MSLKVHKHSFCDLKWVATLALLKCQLVLYLESSDTIKTHTNIVFVIYAKALSHRVSSVPLVTSCFSLKCNSPLFSGHLLFPHVWLSSLIPDCFHLLPIVPFGQLCTPAIVLDHNTLLLSDSFCLLERPQCIILIKVKMLFIENKKFIWKNNNTNKHILCLHIRSLVVLGTLTGCAFLPTVT